ncbi:MAG: recombination mediator RecR [Bdellovibrionota bacterium]
MSFPPALRRLVNELTKLPSIGEKSAIRLAYHLLMRDPAESRALATAINDAREQTKFCEVCFAICEGTICSICNDPNRDRTVLCVVEKPSDVLVIERSGGYRGLYHVLHGLWSPLRGVGPEKTRIGDLFRRLEASKKENADPIGEVVLATGSTVEGDATALYIAKAVSDLGISATRIAQGMPKGGELEFADEITLSHALEGRRSFG